MPPKEIDFDVLNDDAKWADPYDSIELIVAGIWYLHETLKSLYPGCSLLQRILRIGNQFDALNTRSQESPEFPIDCELGLLQEEMNWLGTSGHSLWHLREYFGQPGMRFEIREFSKISSSGNTQGDTLRLRGQGFLLLSAANIAKSGFTLEFIPRTNNSSTPDFYAFKDGNRFCCEATSKCPEKKDCLTGDVFWSVIYETVNQKRKQFRSPDFAHGVLIIDCTPVWETLFRRQLITGGNLHINVPENRGGPWSGSFPLIRYDLSPAGLRLKNLERLIEDTGIRTLILWRNKFTVDGETFRRDIKYAVLGTVEGALFWRYFDKTMVFPGPKVNVNWA